MSDLSLEPVEARVLGVLIEKELTTPEQYPLTLNGLVVGCNQKNNRSPVLELGEGEVREALERLRRKGLVAAAHAAGSRVERYRHQATIAFAAPVPELAVLAELFLRGAETPGDLRARASRMSAFETQEVLGGVLASLEARGLVEKHAPRSGERAPSWSTPLVPSSAPQASPREEARPSASETFRAGGLEGRLLELEQAFAALSRRVDRLEQRSS